MSTMIALVGEQPLPNFLPVLHDKPDSVVFVYTERTQSIYENLKSVLEEQAFVVYGIKTDPYDITKITETLKTQLEELPETTAQAFTFNLTGGTKMMSFAAYQIAAQRNEPVIYFQSEGGKSIVDRYHWQDHQLIHQQKDSLPEYLQLRDMLNLQLGQGKDHSGKNHWEEKGPTIQSDTHSHLFELAIAQALHDDGYEVMLGVKGKGDQLDIDVMIRHRNQVGIIEAKTSQNGKVTNLDGLKQLSTAMRSLRGTYVKQFLVIAGKPARDLQMMSEEILKIRLISLTDYKRGPTATSLSRADRKTLLEAVHENMGAA